jgi:hypothetical protein
VTGADHDPLRRPVAAPGQPGQSKPFGEFTRAEVRARADELRAVVGFGPTTRVAGVARGWSELAQAMDAADADFVSDLGHADAADFARRLWVIPPAGSLL